MKLISDEIISIKARLLKGESGIMNLGSIEEVLKNLCKDQLLSCEKEMLAERKRIIKALEYKSEECTNCGCDCSESLFSKDCAWWQELKPRIREGL